MVPGARSSSALWPSTRRTLDDGQAVFDYGELRGRVDSSCSEECTDAEMAMLLR
jgi:hypothetical protein